MALPELPDVNSRILVAGVGKRRLNPSPHCMETDRETGSRHRWIAGSPRSTTPEGREIIIIGPREILPQIAKKVGGRPVLAFSTLEELDRWRRTPSQPQPGIAADVARALAEAGCRPLRLPAQLQSLLEMMAARTRVPSLHELEEQWDSRRSFYRIWTAEIPSTPSAFLRRVRTLHARRLLAEGMTRKQAAMHSGYHSVDAMRRNIECCDAPRVPRTP